MVKIEDLLMGYPIIGFAVFGQLPRKNYDRYKMYYATKVLIKGCAFYIHDN